MRLREGFWIIILSLVFASGCVLKENIQYTSITGFTQGTSYTITYKSDKLKNYSNDISNILNEINNEFSLYDSNSLLSRLNRNDTCVSLSPRFIEVLQKSFEVYQQSDSLFDITVAPLVEYYGFGANPRTSAIDSSHIDSLLDFVGMSKIIIEGNKLIKAFPEIRIDMNAIAQGYTADVIGRFLEQEKVENYLIEVGGEIKAKGLNPDRKPWRIGIDSPDEKNLIAGSNLFKIIQLTNKSLATSGNYRKFFEENGQKYTHTINPKTGKTVRSKLLSVTIVSDDCMSADAYATACMVMGLEKAKLLITNHPGIDGLLIFAGNDGLYECWYSDAFDSLIVE